MFEIKSGWSLGLYSGVRLKEGAGGRHYAQTRAMGAWSTPPADDEPSADSS